MSTKPVPSDTLVLFGATGDLAHKKIFPSLYDMVSRGNLDVRVVGVAFNQWKLADLQERCRDSIANYGPDEPDPEVVDKLVGLLQYVDGDYADAATFTELKKQLDGAKRPLHYLAIPPVLFSTVVEQLGSSGCSEGARVVVEKPFGRDLASARELNRVLHQVFPEPDIFRMDHYLGKEAVQNILYSRFANLFLEPVWNRNYVASIQITKAEDFGVQGRGKFYEEVGALRDVVENHLLQTLALLTMEPPVGHAVEAIRDEKAKIFKAIRPLHHRHLVRGQFDGYRDEPGVAADSDVETFAACELTIDSWRWEGVPVFLRAGKEMPVGITEVRVDFKRPPQKVFAGAEDVKDPNYLRFRLEPEVAIALGARAKAPGEGWTGYPAELYVCNEFPGEMTAYERLIGDALAGESLLFARQDEVEAQWTVVDPVLTKHDPAVPYAVHTWGPDEAGRLTEHHGGWHDPTS